MSETLISRPAAHNQVIEELLQKGPSVDLSLADRGLKTWQGGFRSDRREFWTTEESAVRTVDFDAMEGTPLCRCGAHDWI